MSHATLIGIHLPKTAGTALREAIDRTPICQDTVYLYDDAPGIPRSQLIAEYPKRHAKKRLIYGHFRFGLHAELAIQAQYLTVLRQPLARALSIFRHHNRHPHSRWHSVARTEGIVGLFALPRGHFTMTRFLATDRDAPETAPDSYYSVADLLALAKENLATSFAHVGMTEDLPRDLPRLSQLLGHDLAIEHQNVDPRPLQEAELSEQERDTIQEAFGVDFELYEYARELRETRFLG